MATKYKKQHLIPKCYLDAFRSLEVPSEHQGNEQYRNGVWIADKQLRKKWRLKEPDNILWKNYYYNLPSDSAELPVIEKTLGIFEIFYPIIRKKLELQTTITTGDLRNLSIFTMMLNLRAEKFQNEFAGTLVQLGEWQRVMDNSGLFNDAQYDQFIQDLRLAPKRLILETDLGALIVKQGVQFVVNRSSALYITSDSPVIRKMCHVDEISAFIGNTEGVDRTSKPNAKHVVILLPITPRIMLVASRFLIEHPNFPYIYCDDDEAVFRLNLFTQSNADQLLISSNRQPFGEREPRVGQFIQNKEVPVELTGDRLLVYTNSNRYWLRIHDWNHGISEFIFRTLDLDTLSAIAKDESLESITIYVDGVAMGGMREIVLGQLDLSGKNPTSIESRVKLPNFGLGKTRKP